jgi:hypothetical protein
MMSASNLRIEGQYEDGAYRCLIDIDGEDCLYCARAGDDAPLNVWILERVAAWEAAGNVVPDWVDLAPAPLQSNGVQTL